MAGAEAVYSSPWGADDSLAAIVDRALSRAKPLADPPPAPKAASPKPDLQERRNDRDDSRHGDRNRDSRRRSRSRSPRRRSRSRSRSPRRRRSRSPRRRSPRRRSRSRSRSRSPRQKSRAAEPAPQEVAPADQFAASAAMLADRFVEAFGESSAKRHAHMEECFARSAEVRALQTDVVLVPSGRALADLFRAVPRWRAEVGKRLFLECDRPGAATFCVDFHVGGCAPAWGPSGVLQQPTQADIVVLYRAVNEKIDRVWVGVDSDGLARFDDAEEIDIVESQAYKAVLNVAVAPGGLLGAITRVFSDYKKIPVIG